MEDTPQQPGGGRTLGGDGVASRYVPPSASTAAGGSSSSSRQAAPRGGGRGAGMATLRDLQGGSLAGHGHSHDDDDDDDENQDMFAGGEKSGLAVQNPNSNNPQDQVDRMLQRARRYRP